jgi:hypothetical protein
MLLYQILDYLSRVLIFLDGKIIKIAKLDTNFTRKFTKEISVSFLF